MLLGRGMIVLPEAAVLTNDSTAEVRIEDVSLADASATTVATKIIPDLLARVHKSKVRFAIYGQPLLPHRRYSVRAEINVDGVGDIDVGDFVSTVSYPIAAGKRPAKLKVVVHRID